MCIHLIIIFIESLTPVKSHHNYCFILFSQKLPFMNLFYLFFPSISAGFWFSVPLLLSIVSLVILLILISILLYWKRRRTQDRGELLQEVQKRNHDFLMIIW